MMGPTETKEVNSTSGKLKGAAGELTLFYNARILGEVDRRLVSKEALPSSYLILMWYVVEGSGGWITP